MPEEGSSQSYGEHYTGCSFNSSTNLHGVLRQPLTGRFILQSVAKKKKNREKLRHRPLPLLLEPHRRRLGWSQVKLAELTEVSDATIVRIEAGEQNWKQEFLQRAAAALGVHWLDLLPLAEEVKRRA